MEAAAAFELPDEDSLLKKVYPWEPTSDPSQATRDAVHFQLWKTSSEMRRCEEEVAYIPGDARRVMAYYKRQILLLVSDQAARWREQMSAAAVAAAGGVEGQDTAVPALRACSKDFLTYHKLLELLCRI